MKIKDIVTFVSKSITPKPGVTYNLYSLPSFDEGKTSEILDGTEIQSNKYDVPNKCILFNKLNVRFRRVWKECVPRGIFHRRKDGNFADTSAERQPLYFLIPRLHPGGASDGAGALHYPQSAGRLLRRNDLRAGDPRYLFQCTSVSRYWTQFSGNLRIVSFAALI